MRQRAMSNWKKLKVLLVMLKLSGGRVDPNLKIQNDEQNPHNDESEEAHDPKEKAKSCRERVAPYIINPNNPYKIAWDVLIGVVYLIAYIIDPYVFSFHEVEAG